jgi:hypothetical protein
MDLMLLFNQQRSGRSTMLLLKRTQTSSFSVEALMRLVFPIHILDAIFE